MDRTNSPQKYLSTKRVVLNAQSRQIVLNVYANLRLQYCDKPVKEIVRQVSDLCGISESTIYKLKKEFIENDGILRTPNKIRPDNQKKNRRCSIYDDFEKKNLRRIVHDMYRQGIPPTGKKVATALEQDENLKSLSVSATVRLLKEIGFKYQTIKRKSLLIDDGRIAAWRQKYLLQIKKYRAENKDIFYLDETWVNSGHFVKKAFCDTSIETKRDAQKDGLTTGLKQPKGKGSRLIILNIGSRNGFLGNSSLVFQAKKSTGDYHDEMNGDNFSEWFAEVLPRLPKSSVIVMDNASYHSVASDRIPNRSWRKSQIQDWLSSKDIYFHEDYTVRELLEVVTTMKPEVKYIIDEMAKEAGMTILRLPPYHCELNPIEPVWNQVKHYVATRNTTFKLSDVEVLVHDAFANVTPQNWMNYENHIIKTENEMMKLEHLQDCMVEKLIVNLEQDSSDDDDYDDDEVLATPLI